MEGWCVKMSKTGVTYRGNSVMIMETGGFCNDSKKTKEKEKNAGKQTDSACSGSSAADHCRAGLYVYQLSDRKIQPVQGAHGVDGIIFCVRRR